MPNIGGIALDERSQSANVGREAGELNRKTTIGRGANEANPRRAGRLIRVQSDVGLKQLRRRIQGEEWGSVKPKGPT